MLSDLFIVFVLTLVNGLFSMSEIAILSARKSRLESAAKRGDVGAKRVLELASSPNRFLSAVQIGITLVAIMLGMFSGDSVVNAVKFFIENLPFPALYPYAKSVGTAINLLFIGFISLIFGELVPKRIGMSKPEAIAKFVSIPMAFVSRIAAPFVWLLSKTTELLMRVFNIKADESKVTEEEIRALIDEGASVGTLEAVEQDIMERVIHLGDKRVGALMTNRNDLVWLNVNDPEDELLALIGKDMHAVYPICDDSLDEVLGLVSLKDILTVQLRKEPFDLRKIMRPVQYLPENMSAYGAMEKFKQTKIHYNLVVDEYGTVIGILTMTDVLEAIVGDIGENEDIAYEIVQREDGSWLLDGQFPWDDFLNEFELDDNTHIKEGFHTIAGFLLYELQDLPKAGTIVRWRDLAFEVVDMDGARIDKIIVSKK